jgi:cytochrome subunit of sulfide dehydrogenase
MTRNALIAVLACIAMPVKAQDSPAARSLAATCASCHGTEGRSATTEVVSLAGLPRDHITRSMKAFRDGSRPATVMHQIAKGYSDEQIELMAEYFSRRPR